MKLTKLSAINDATIRNLFREYSRLYTYHKESEWNMFVSFERHGKVVNMTLPNNLQMTLSDPNFDRRAEDHHPLAYVVSLITYDTRWENKSHDPDYLSVLGFSAWQSLGLAHYFKCHGTHAESAKSVMAHAKDAAIICERVLAAPACDWADRFANDARFDLPPDVVVNVTPTCEVSAERTIEPRGFDEELYVKNNDGSIWKFRRDAAGNICSGSSTNLKAIPT